MFNTISNSMRCMLGKPMMRNKNMANKKCVFSRALIAIILSLGPSHNHKSKTNNREFPNPCELTLIVDTN